MVRLAPAFCVIGWMDGIITSYLYTLLRTVAVGHSAGCRIGRTTDHFQIRHDGFDFCGNGIDFGLDLQANHECHNGHNDIQRQQGHNANGDKAKLLGRNASVGSSFGRRSGAATHGRQ